MADKYLPAVVRNVPAEWLFGRDGRLLPKVQRYRENEVVRVIAGPTLAHVVIDVKRPYDRPRQIRAD